MAADITPVEISNNPELLRLAEEVKATNKQDSWQNGEYNCYEVI